MYTKSKIQQITEKLKVLEGFERKINNILEKYTVENSIFTIYNNDVMEVVKGYFVIEENFDNLHDAIRKLGHSGNALRIIDEQFQTGNIYMNISECPKNTEVYDIVAGEVIEW